MLQIENFKGVIFDMDGTLVNTLEEIGRTVNEVLTLQGLPPHDLENYRSFIGRGIQHLMSSALPQNQRTPEILQECLANLQTIYPRYINKYSALYPGIEKLLNLLAEKKIKMAILTNKSHHLAQLCYIANLKSWDMELLGYRPEIPAKPDPQGAIILADKFAVKPRQCFFVGDSDVDILTARNAGMTSSGALWGFQNEEKLKEAGAEFIFN
ncbi:MAG: HAD family hydrolase, partial [Candidatus Neomarinimicrobiota bacterium]